MDDAIDRLVREGLIEEERESRGDAARASRAASSATCSTRASRRASDARSTGAAGRPSRRGTRARVDRVLPQLVQHFYQGDVPEKAVDYGLRLAKSSLDTFSVEEAVRAAKTVLDCLDEEWQGERALEGEARLLLAEAERVAGHAEVALQQAAAAARLFEELGRPARAAFALLFAAETAWQARRSEEAGRSAEKGVALARDAGSAEILPRLLSLAATLANLRGEYAKANAYLEEATRLAPEPGEAAAEEIPRGGTLVVGLANPVRSLTPATLEIAEELEIVSNVFETLLATDGRGNLTPALCEKWQVLEAGRAFLLTLRRGVSFSDGSPLAARDVKASIEACVSLRDRDMPPAFAALQGSAEHREGRSAIGRGRGGARRRHAGAAARRAAPHLSRPADRPAHGDRTRAAGERGRGHGAVPGREPRRGQDRPRAQPRLLASGSAAARRARVPGRALGHGGRPFVPSGRDRSRPRPRASGPRGDPPRRPLPSRAGRDPYEQHLLRAVQLPQRLRRARRRRAPRHSPASYARAISCGGRWGASPPRPCA